MSFQLKEYLRISQMEVANDNDSQFDPSNEDRSPVVLILKDNGQDTINDSHERTFENPSARSTGR